MNPKVAVILLAVVVVAVVLLAVYGTTRPAGPEEPSADGSGVERWLGGLRFTEALTVDHLADTGAACVDREDGMLRVAAGGACVIPLPELDTSAVPLTEVLTLCGVEGALTVTLAGVEFEPQEFEPGEVGCDPPLELDAYDSGSHLTLTCSLAGPCAARVVEP